MKRAFSIVAAALALVATQALAQGKVEVLWLGQSAMRITPPAGKVIMVDPWILGNPKTPPAWKNLDAVGKLDLILVTHGGSIEPFGAGGVKVTATHAEHSSELLYKNAATGKDETWPGGEPVGFIIQLENGMKIYHMGDTGLFGDMKFIGEYYKPDIVMIPIGGHFVMSPQDAAYAVREWLKPKYAIPMHYGTIPQLKGTPEEFIKAGTGATKVIVMNPGDKVEF